VRLKSVPEADPRMSRLRTVAVIITREVSLTLPVLQQ
jgi:hypothetical protein